MIVIANSDAEEASVHNAIDVIRRLRRQRMNTYPTRPDIQDTPWVKTVWPNEAYL